MSLYICIICSEPIPAAKARIQCQECTSYDLCASCFVVGKASLAHRVSHDTVLFATSGHNFANLSKLKQPSVPITNPLVRRRPLIAPPSLPPRHQSSSLPSHSGLPPTPQVTQPVLQEPIYQPTATQAEPQYQAVPPPGAYTPSPSYQVDTPTHQVPNQTNNQHVQNAPPPAHLSGNPYSIPLQPINTTPQPSIQPPLPTPPLAENPYANPPLQQSSTGDRFYTPTQAVLGTPTQWQTLQTAGTPSPFLRTMLTAVFDRIDTARTGFLSPEQYSGYLDVQQYRLEEDVWKKNLLQRPGYNPQDLADFELRLTYENFGIDHRLQTRNIAPSQMPPLSEGKMPMLTPIGFIELTFIELFSDATPLGLSRMNMILRHYGVWRELGDIPRNLWPATPPQELVERVRRMSAAARNRTQELIDANKVKLQLQAQGRQNAIDLLDPPGTRYYYQY